MVASHRPKIPHELYSLSFFFFCAQTSIWVDKVEFRYYRLIRVGWWIDFFRKVSSKPHYSILQFHSLPTSCTSMITKNVPLSKTIKSHNGSHINHLDSMHIPVLVLHCPVLKLVTTLDNMNVTNHHKKNPTCKRATLLDSFKTQLNLSVPPLNLASKSQTRANWS